MGVVLSTHPLHPDAVALLAGRHELRIASGLDAATLERECAEADIVIVRAPIPPSVIAAAPRLRALVRHGAGLDMIPVDAATNAGVLVANVPGVNAQSVAEHVLMTTLMLLRRYRPVDIRMRRGDWAGARAEAEHGRELATQHVGIVGFGHVGQAVAKLFVPLVAGVRAFSPSGRAPADLSSPLADLFSDSDVLVLCCPLTPETQGLVNAASLSLMKPGAFVVNVARGGVVDDEAMRAALEAGLIGGAALDVFASQPLSEDNPYLSMPDVVVTPHVAGLSDDSMRAMSVGAVEEAIRILQGESPLNLVNPEACRDAQPGGRGAA